MAAAARTAQPNTTTPGAAPVAGTSHWAADAAVQVDEGKGEFDRVTDPGRIGARPGGRGPARLAAAGARAVAEAGGGDADGVADAAGVGDALADADTAGDAVGPAEALADPEAPAAPEALADPEALAEVTAVGPAAGPGTMYFSGPSQNTATSAVTVNSPASHRNA